MSALIALKSFPNGPAKAINAVGDGLAADSGPVAPLHQGQGNSSEGYMTVVRSVILLLFHSGPAAVSRLIAARVVNPIYRMLAGWTWPHIFQEKAIIFPTLTNNTSIIVPMRKIGPNPIGAGFPAAARISVYRALFIFLHDLCGVIAFRLKTRPVQVFRQTTARTSIAKNKPISWGYKYSAAITLAFPGAVMLSIDPKTANGRQAGEFLSTQILRASHDWY